MGGYKRSAEIRSRNYQLKTKDMKEIKKYLYQIFHTRKVKVIKCDNRCCWYYKKIGETFIVVEWKNKPPYLNNGETYYISIDKGNSTTRFYIKKSDVKTYINF